MDERYRTLVHVLAYGGLRWGETAALRRGRCQLLRGRLEIRESLAEVDGQLHFGTTKTHAIREVALPPFLVDALARHLATAVDEGSNAFVFTAPGSGPMRHGNFTRRFWRPAVDAAPVPSGLRIHDLRHTAASLLIASGANVKAVQSQLGHKSAVTTLDRYGHLFPDDLDRLAEALNGARRDALAASSRPGAGSEVTQMPTGTTGIGL
jgi:integrase